MTRLSGKRSYRGDDRYRRIDVRTFESEATE